MPFSRLAGGCPQVIAPQDSKHFFQSRRIQYAEQQNKDTALLTLAGVLALAGCAKKAAKVTPPPPPAPAPIAPTATLAANPSVVQQGQTSTLTWQTSNATDVTIASVGELTSSGSRSVTPRHRQPTPWSPKARVEPAKPPPASPSIPQSPASHLHPRMRNCSARMSRMCSSTTQVLDPQ